jgi:hypothetical protein
MSVSAEDSAFWSDELTAPELTSDCNSACNNCRGDWQPLLKAAEIEVMKAPKVLER